MKAVIISGGNAPSRGLFQEEVNNSDLVICADSGGRIAYDYGIDPDYLVGDFDSIGQDVLKFFSSTKCKIEKYPPEKDSTDTEIALELAAGLKVDSICFLGCTGSRLDHFMGNLGMLKKCLSYGIKATMKDDNNTIFLTDREIELEGRRGQIFSLMAYCDKVDKLTIEGAKYKLTEYNLLLGDSLTVSNEFWNNKVNITFESGKLLIFLSKD